MTRKPIEIELAAVGVMAAKLGLGPIEPQILKLAKHTTAQLAPLPFVARIQSAGPLDQAYANASREVTVATQLAARGAPTVRPASNLSRGPHVEDGCVITLWELAAGRAAETEADAFAAAGALKKVHEALECVAADLPSFTVTIASCERILAGSASAPHLHENDRHFLHGLYADLREQLTRRELIYRPLHGDTHLANVLITGAGARWMDLEAVCVGPLEWDVVTLPSATWSTFEGLDPGLMRLLKALRSVCVATWCWADLDRSAEVADAAVHHLDTLKARFD